VVQSQTANLGDIQIHYVEASGPGPALVFVHGITGSHTGFLPFLTALAQDAHIYAIDLRGHGRSGRMSGAYQVPDYGRDVIAFIRSVVGRPAFVAGHSLGGLAAIWAAAHAPELVRGLLLEDPPLYITDMPRFKETEFYDYFIAERENLLGHHASQGSVEHLIEYVAQMPVDDEQTMLEAAGIKSVHERAHQLHQLDPTTLDPAIDGVITGQAKIDDLLSEVSCPVYLLAGEIKFGGALSTPERNQDYLSTPIRSSTMTLLLVSSFLYV
jgi:pimeloyl-ACP methyl ester carboxylesterase